MIRHSDLSVRGRYMDEDNRLLTKLDMAYSPVFNYRFVATLGSQGLTARLGAYLFCNRGQAA